MDTREVTKNLVKIVAGSSVAAITSRILTNYVPVTRNLRIGDAVGLVVGAVAVGQMEGPVDTFVDNWFEARASTS